MSRCELLVIGDALLDRDIEVSCDRDAPDAPVPVLDERRVQVRPGGGALAAALAADQGCGVSFVTAFAQDEAARELRAVLLDAGVDIVDLGMTGHTPEKIRFIDAGGPLLRFDRGGDPGKVLGEGVVDALSIALRRADCVLVSDYGRGVCTHQEVRAALTAVAGHVLVVWDPHPAGGVPIANVTLATPNLREAIGFASAIDIGGADLAELAMALAKAWQAQAVALTLGCEGALLARKGRITSSSSRSVMGDPCGAGDRFAVAAAMALAQAEDCARAVESAVAQATEFVSAGGAHAFSVSRHKVADRLGQDTVPSAPLASALMLARRVRRSGGTVVATGGCFDLLHAGHVRLLDAAASCGDCLIVLLNSDASVRRLKGSDRPLICEQERAEMLKALGCVDEVAIFDESTPIEALRLLRPDVWAKGGDYALYEIPESRELPTWGGRVVILPFLEGRSTTKLIQEVGTRVSR